MKRRPAQGKTKKNSFPVVVERGPTGVKGTATIHRTPTTVDGKTYESFTVVYYHAGSRHRLRFNKYAKAYSKAEEIATELSNGRKDALFLSGDERRIYEAAVEGLEKVGNPALDTVVREYIAAKEKLGTASLVEAATFFKTHGGGAVKKASLAEIRKEMLEALKADQRSSYHIRDVARHTKRFVEYFSCPITAITSSRINEWLRGLPGGGRNRDNHRDSIHNFFNFARSEGYLPKSLPTAAEDTKRVNEAGADNEVFTVEEANSLLQGAHDWLLPTLAIKLFSGMRSEEVFRMDWSAVKFDQDVLVLSKEITKTKLRRPVPLLPNLKLWLLPHRESKGRIAGRWISAKTMCRAWTDNAEKVGVVYKKNAMRKSYISYRVAETKDVAQVALESGNSPAIIQSDYLELVTEADAKRWFAIVPT